MSICNVYCDNCGFVHPGVFTHALHAVESLRVEGWSMVKDETTGHPAAYRTLCPKCRGQQKKKTLGQIAYEAAVDHVGFPEKFAATSERFRNSWEAAAKAVIAAYEAAKREEAASSGSSAEVPSATKEKQ